MPFIPHTEDDVEHMLSAIGVESLDDLFDEIPQELLAAELDGLPEACLLYTSDAAVVLLAKPFVFARVLKISW